MYHILLIIHVILTVAMIAIILVQRSATDGLGGIGGGGGGGFMTSRGQANLLTRTTAILAALFIINSLALSWLTQRDTHHSSIADKIVEKQAEMPKVPAPGKISKKEGVAELSPASDKAKSDSDKSDKAEVPASTDVKKQPVIPQPEE